MSRQPKKAAPREDPATSLRGIVETSTDPGGGTTDVLIGIARGVATDERAEEAHQQNEHSYRSLYNQTPVMMHSIDHKGVVMSVNDYWLDAMGYDRAEVLGRPITAFMTEESREYAREVSIPLLGKTGAAHGIQYRWIKSSGEIIDVLLSAIAEFDDRGKIDHSLAFILDVTEQKKAEEALQKSEARFRRLVEHAADIFLLVDTDDSILDVNQRACDQLGYSRGELLQLKVSQLNLSITEEKLREIYETITPDEVVTSDGLYRRKDGSTFPAEVRIGAFLESGKKYRVALVRDMTERIEAEQALRERTAELEAFTYSVSHDLRAPLRAIDGFAQALEEDFGGRLDDEANRLLGVIRSSSARMGRLIDDLLSFSRLSRRDLKPVRVDMTELTQAVWDELMRGEEGRSLELKLGELLAVRGDRNMMRQVLMNLISNAVKFTRGREPAVVEVACRCEGSDTVYFVRDNGVGFDMRYGDKLFGVFQRLHADHEFEGTGVGLAIVDRVVRRHGGRVWAESELGSGATIFFSLPAA